jgi:hypothetical protein
MFTTKEDPSIRQLGGYFFVANGRTTNSALAVENVAFDLTTPYGYYCKVQLNFVTRSNGNEDDAIEERFQALASEFVEGLLPHLATVLPDWREYEPVEGRIAAEEAVRPAPPGNTTSG